ncbi:MAG: sulfur oxidation c-type cytochrome SoxX [Burkholderiales bacterium]|nr:sulfur oxidation c-type cytochrome SoxX [Burkholderiales bacterium]
MHIYTKIAASCAVIAAAIAGCATGPNPQDVDRITAEVIKSSFRDEGPVKIDRLVQDDSNRECSQAEASGTPIAPARAKQIEEANLKLVKWPSDGKFLGDWKEGEKIAQSGRGLTWTDDPKAANGGNCYNCHQIAREEISFGTIGPSLYNYGKLRGVTDPNSAAAKPIVEYTWGKIWNAKAYNACSNMPRVGHNILDEAQVRHVTALLLDPQSPVNK